MIGAHLPEGRRHPDGLSGARVFRESRVPVPALFAYLGGGATVGESPEWFLGVSRWGSHERRLGTRLTYRLKLRESGGVLTRNRPEPVLQIIELSGAID